MRRSREDKIAERMREGEERRARQYRALAYLKHVRGLGLRARALEKEVTRMREGLDGLKAAANVGRVHNGCSYADAVPDALARLEDAIRAYSEELAHYVEEQRRAHDFLRTLPADQSAVLTRRFLLGEHLREVALDAGLSLELATSLESAGLDSLYERMPQFWRDLEVPEEPDFDALRREVIRDVLAI